MMSALASSSGDDRFSIRPDTRHLILCEGRDDQGFLLHYINSEVFSEYDRSAIQVDQMRGIDKMPFFVQNLPNQDDFSQLLSVLIIVDADRNTRSAKDKVRGAFQRAGLPVPEAEHQWEAGTDAGTNVRTSFLLFPSCGEQSQTGALEDLCWALLNDKYGPLIHDEVSNYIETLEAEGKRIIKHKTKALVHTYFSSTEELIAAGISRAAEAGVFDWTSPKLDQLHGFLVSMMGKTALEE